MPKIYIQDLIIPKHDALLYDVLDHKHTHYTLYGGRGGAKSAFISVAINLLLTQHKDAHAIVFRKVANTLRDSVYAQMSYAISLLHMDNLFRRAVSPMEMTYLPTGQKILFRGLDQPEKIKSIKAPFGHFGITWFEEIDQFKGREEIRTVLQSTMRGEGGSYWNFESFNPPITASNWANKDLLIPRPDRLITESCYLDVPAKWLSEQFLEEARQLQEVNEKAYRHEYLGEPVGTGTNVFENLTIRQITDAEIASMGHFYYGLDFGWIDPTAFVQMSYDSAKQTLYITKEIFRTKTSLEDFSRLIEEYRSNPIIADSAEPRSINTLRSLGNTVIGATKGPGSLEFSMKWLQSLREIVIDPARCPRTADEWQSYEYEKDKEGNVISAYPDGNDHSISAVRYGLQFAWMKYPKKS